MTIDIRNSDWTNLAAGIGAQLTSLQTDWAHLLSSRFSVTKGEPFSLSILPRHAAAQTIAAPLPERGSADDVLAALIAASI